jgi:hypothetical protein
VAPPKRKAGGRVTPKGTRPGEPKPNIVPNAEPNSRWSNDEKTPHHAAAASTRYTPPVPVKVKMGSPTWVPVLMFALWIIGALIIILYYLSVMPGDSQWWLLVGLGLIMGGLYAATKFR